MDNIKLKILKHINIIFSRSLDDVPYELFKLNNGVTYTDVYKLFYRAPQITERIKHMQCWRNMVKHDQFHCMGVSCGGCICHSHNFSYKQFLFILKKMSIIEKTNEEK